MLTTNELVTAISTQITTALATPTVPGAWSESRFPYDQFPGPDGPEVEHHGFAIWLPSTDPPGRPARQGRMGSGLSEVAIRFAHRLRSEGAVVDMREALSAEAELLVALTSDAARHRGFALAHTGTSRSTTKSGLAFVGELHFTTTHQYP